jgi:hypothetical protein
LQSACGKTKYWRFRKITTLPSGVGFVDRALDADSHSTA